MASPYDFRSIEPKWQEKWRAAHIFEPQPKPGKKKFFVTSPYPYTTGVQHIGHGRAFTLGDLYARFKRMQGYNVLFPMAFHISGTPILAVSKQVARGDEKTTKMYSDYVRVHTHDENKVKEIMQSFKEPRNVALYFAKTFKQDFQSMGFSNDWTRDFTTGDKDYSTFVTWHFLKLKELGLITKGSYPVLYCTSCENAVGEDDIKDGDQIEADATTYTAVKFPFEDGFLVAATFRPETIFGATNMFINPDADYVKVNVEGEKWIISKEAAEKLKLQRDNIMVLYEIKGKALIGKTFKSPVEDREMPILAASFVSPSNATGVVFSVPAHAPYDYIALRDAGKLEEIPMISVVNTEGFGKYPARDVSEKLGIKTQNDAVLLEKANNELYKVEFYKGRLNENCKQFAGRLIHEAKDDMVAWLKSKNAATDFYDVTALQTPVKCRCDGSVVVAVLKDQWFIHYGDKAWKEKARKALANMTIFPNTYRKLFESTFDWLDQRPCARKRGIGTRLPFDHAWIIESLSDSTIYMSFYTVKRKINEYKLEPEQLTEAFWDFVLLGKGTAEQVSKSTRIPAQQLKAMREEFLYWYPVDFRGTGVPHLSNHLSFYIFNHAALFPEKLWPKTILVHEMLISEGLKMSKSRGNIVSLLKIAKEYSADLYRLYITSGADLASVVDWRETDVSALRSRLLKFYEMCSEAKKGKAKPTKLSSPDKWLLSRMNKRIKECTNLLESYDLRNFVQKAFFETMNDITQYKTRAGKPNKAVLSYVIERWIKLMAPITPHMCEELWHALGNKTFISVEKWPESQKSMIDERAERAEELCMGVEREAQQLLEMLKIQKPKSVTLFTAPSWKRELYKHASKTQNPNELMKLALKMPAVKGKEQEVAGYCKWLTKQRDMSKPMTEQQEHDALKSCLPSLQKKLGCKITIAPALSSDNAQAKRAAPMKPGVFIE